ncbi:hypothetical protein HDU98_000113 [Podochytrium sp. JEL0797]|nr:hypothetical protein HDU98_000113 [Podochytrium sp. JEL0797]
MAPKQPVAARGPRWKQPRERTHKQEGRCSAKLYKDVAPIAMDEDNSADKDHCRFDGFRLFAMFPGQSQPIFGPVFDPSPVDCGDPLFADLDAISQQLSDSNSDKSYVIKVDGRDDIHTTHENEVYVLENTASTLLSILDDELKSLGYDGKGSRLHGASLDLGAGNTESDATCLLQPAILRPGVFSKENPLRHLCDECATSLFNMYFMCAICGVEICVDCFSHMGEQHTISPMLESDDQDSPVWMSCELPNQSKRFEQQWQVGSVVKFSGGEECNPMWNPSHFIAHHGTEMVVVQDCMTMGFVEMSVGKFFEHFGEYGNKRTQILKLPDWPADADFSKKFPGHFEDFKKLLPVPLYSGFAGPRNLAARLLIEFSPPDLGPKMYNALGRRESVGFIGNGTTPLHFDMADAVNIMMYASVPCQPLPLSTSISNQSGLPPAAAVWDIYPRKYSDDIRAFIKRLTKDQDGDLEDPIHDQNLYLDIEMRSALRKEGVKSWRVWQNPGDAVFIPAG